MKGKIIGDILVVKEKPDDLDEILKSSGTFISKNYGSTKRAGAAYFADDKGIWRFSKETSDRKLF